MLTGSKDENAPVRMPGNFLIRWCRRRRRSGEGLPARHKLPPRFAARLIAGGGGIDFTVGSPHLVEDRVRRFDWPEVERGPFREAGPQPLADLLQYVLGIIG